MLKKYSFTIIIILLYTIFHLQGATQTISFSDSLKIYLIPGQGSDYRIFSKLDLPDKYDTINVKHIIPIKNETLCDYSNRISSQIDTTNKFALIGVSLGGMVATELADLLKPEVVILISSAKCRAEIPKRYRFMRKMPIYKIVPPKLYKLSSYLAQPIVEPDRKKEKDIFSAMLHDKNPIFLKRATQMIINWDREEFSSDIIHIHGNNDHTLPYRNIKADYTIKNGSHMMMLTNSKEINPLIINILSSLCKKTLNPLNINAILLITCLNLLVFRLAQVN